MLPSTSAAVTSRRLPEPRRLGVQQPPHTDLEPLDARRGDRLRAQQKARQRLTVGQSADLEAEAGECRLGFTDVRRNRPFENHGTPDQSVGQVGLVVAGESVPARQAGTLVAHPMAPDNLGHTHSLIKVTTQPCL